MTEDDSERRSDRTAGYEADDSADGLTEPLHPSSARDDRFHTPVKLPRGAARAHYLGFRSSCNEMDTPDALLESNLHSLPLIARGKVRDIYRVDEERLLIVASDRMSAFDVVLPDPIPGKGVVLTAISNFWLHRLEA